MSAGAATRRLSKALCLTGLVLVAEVAGGIVSGSLALLSDAGHMLIDVGALALALWASIVARRPADATRSYGFARLEILSAVVNGVILLLVAVGVIVEAVERLAAGPRPVRVGLMAAFAAGGLAANLLCLRLLRAGATTDFNLRAALLHLMSDAASSLAVMLAAAVIAATGFERLDPILSIAIAISIVVGAYRFLREAVDVLLESVPRQIDPGAVREAIRAVPGVRDLHDLHIWTIASGFFALSGHLTVSSDRAADAILAEANDLLARRFSIAHTTLQIESAAYAECRSDHP